MTVLECYGVRVAIQGLKSEELAAMCRSTGFARGDSSEPISGVQVSFSKGGSDYHLVVDGAFLGESSSLELVIEMLKSHLIKKVASANPDLLFLRGDVIRTASGDVVVIAGPSISGKTRLAQAFVERDAAVFSQDAVVLDPSGKVLAFPAQNVPTSALSPTVLLMLDYDQDVVLKLEDLSAGQAVLRLTGAQLLPFENQSEVFARLGQLVTRVKTYVAGKRGDCVNAAASLGELFGL